MEEKSVRKSGLVTLTETVEKRIRNEVMLLGQPMPNKHKIFLPFLNVSGLVEYLRNKYKETYSVTLVNMALQKLEKLAMVVCTGRLKKDTFLRCATCDALTEQMKQAQSHERIECIKEAKRNHTMQFTGDRQILWYHNQKALRQPDKYISVQYDGMDGNKTMVPHVVGARTHGNDVRMKMHCVGVYSCGTPESLFVYTSTPHFAGNANLSITILHQWLQVQAALARAKAKQACERTLEMQQQREKVQQSLSSVQKSYGTDCLCCVQIACFNV